jgi:hypothetical protein
LGALHLFLDRPEKVLPAAADLADGVPDTPEGVELHNLVRRLVG